jgi:modulator of FtsH protease HflK
MGKINKETVKRFFSKPSTVIWIIVIVVALIAVESNFYSVDETEQAVITRFGKYNTTVGPGLHLKLPFGIDKNYNIPVKVVQTEQFGFSTVKSGRNNEYRNNIVDESTMLTGDLNIINVEWIIQYRIVDPKAWLFNVQERTQTIRDISRSVINTLVGDRAILDVMGQERSNIEVQSQEMMNQNFKQLGLGINIIAVKLQNIVPPQGVQDAFEDVNKATQDMNRFINEGKEAYNSEIPKAQGEADQQIQIAQGYAAERVNEAKGDVARFNAVYDEYRRAPKVTRERIYLETMDDLFSSDTKPTLIDGKLGNILPVKSLTGGNSVSPSSSSKGAAQ